MCNAFLRGTQSCSLCVSTCISKNRLVASQVERPAWRGAPVFVRPAGRKQRGDSLHRWVSSLALPAFGGCRNRCVALLLAGWLLHEIDHKSSATRHCLNQEALKSISVGTFRHAVNNTSPSVSFAAQASTTRWTRLPTRYASVLHDAQNMISSRSFTR